jgi:hypothetical protein
MFLDLPTPLGQAVVLSTPPIGSPARLSTPQSSPLRPQVRPISAFSKLLLHRPQIFRAPLTHRPDDGGSTHLWNVRQYLPDYMAQHLRRQPSSDVWSPHFRVLFLKISPSTPWSPKWFSLQGATCPVHLILLDLITLIIWRKLSCNQTVTTLQGMGLSVQAPVLSCRTSCCILSLYTRSHTFICLARGTGI